MLLAEYTALLAAAAGFVLRDGGFDHRKVRFTNRIPDFVDQPGHSARGAVDAPAAGLEGGRRHKARTVEVSVML